MRTNKTVSINIQIPDGLTKDGETRFILAKCISFALDRHNLSVEAKKDLIDRISRMIMTHGTEKEQFKSFIKDFVNDNWGVKNAGQAHPRSLQVGQREYLSGWDTEEAEKYIEGYLWSMYFSEEVKEHLKFATENEED